MSGIVMKVGATVYLVIAAAKLMCNLMDKQNKSYTEAYTEMSKVVKDQVKMIWTSRVE